MTYLPKNGKNHLSFKRKIDRLFYGKSYESILFNNILLFISASLIVLVVFSSFYPENKIIIAIEFFLGVLFSIEYILRFWVSRNKIKYVFSVLGLVDVVVILSLFAPAFVTNLGFLKVLRSLQILRVYKASGSIKKYKKNAFIIKNKEVIIGTLNLIVFLLLMSSLVYTFQSDINDGINNYLDAMYFTVTTLTTTGFGDITPEGWIGKLLAIVIMTFGLTFFLKLVKSIFKRPKNYYPCPDCGLEKHDIDAIHCKHCGHIIKNKMLENLE